MENMHTDVGCKGLTYIFLNLYFDVNEFVDQRMPILCFFQVLWQATEHPYEPHLD